MRQPPTLLAPPPRRLSWIGTAAGMLLCTIAWAPGSPAQATVFHSRDEIAAIAFPDCDRVETRRIFLTAGERERIEKIAGSRLDSDLLSVYRGYRGAERVGYALLDTHLVRSMTQTLLVVIDANGTVAATYVMAFHEPSEYMVSERWLRLFEDRPLTDDLRVGRAIVGITGSTLTARAVVSSVRRALAIHEVLFAQEAE
jgi:hypothetical protein